MCGVWWCVVVCGGVWCVVCVTLRQRLPGNSLAFSSIFLSPLDTTPIILFKKMGNGPSSSRKGEQVVDLNAHNNNTIDDKVDNVANRNAQKGSEKKDVSFDYELPKEATMKETKVKKDGEPPLLIAAKRGDIETVRQLLNKGAGVDTMNKEGITALHRAVQNVVVGGEEIVKELIKRKANVNAKNILGRTPLIDAVYNVKNLISSLHVLYQTGVPSYIALLSIASSTMIVFNKTKKNKKKGGGGLGGNIQYSLPVHHIQVAQSIPK
jgi:ankyrin repeat protein